jgi:hypothetical protein
MFLKWKIYNPPETCNTLCSSFSIVEKYKHQNTFANFTKHETEYYDPRTNVIVGDGIGGGGGSCVAVTAMTTGWTVRGSNPGGGEFFAHVQTGPGAHPASCAMGTGSFPGVKRPERGADHPPPSSAEVENA